MCFDHDFVMHSNNNCMRFTLKCYLIWKRYLIWISWLYMQSEISWHTNNRSRKKTKPKKVERRKNIELKKNLSQKKRTKIKKNAQIHNHQPQTSKNVRSHFPLCSPFNYDQIACDEWRTCNITPQYAKTTEITIFRDFKWIGIINVFVGFFLFVLYFLLNVGTPNFDNKTPYALVYTLWRTDWQDLRSLWLDTKPKDRQ